MMSWREALLFVFALVSGVLGLLLVGGYVWSAWSVLGEPDRSVIFWYSPFLMFGLFLIGVAAAFGMLWWIMRRESDDRHERGQ